MPQAGQALGVKEGLAWPCVRANPVFLYYPCGRDHDGLRGLTGAGSNESTR